MGLLSPFLAVLLGAVASAQDWPTYRNDNARSGVGSTRLRWPLTELWVHRSPHAPRPAWPGPARRDAYNKVENLKSRLAFDRAFAISIADGRLFYGSSADDQVRALDAATGASLWRFFTEGPVRFAPTVWRGKVFVGSDDGRVYCLDAATGKVVWSRRAAPRDRRVPGNGRMVSVWPVRTGVVVERGVAYCGAGVFPSEGTWLCAFDAATGRPVFRRELGDLHPQGYILASPSSIYVPNGRGQPVVFAREDGARLRTLGGAGGSYALLVGDSLIYGPGKSGQLEQFAGKDHVATFSGNRMIVSGDMAYLHSDDELRALRRSEYLGLLADKRALAAAGKKLAEQIQALREDRGDAAARRARTTQQELEKMGAELARIDRALHACIAWRRACPLPLELILSDGALVAGGVDEIAMFATEGDGEQVWRADVDGFAYGLAAAGGRLYASTDRGVIHCFGAEAGPR